jgi:hypothetical protein
MAELTKEGDLVQNPALGAAILWRTAAAYSKAARDSKPIPLPLLFTILPLVLSSEYSQFLKTTSVRSNLRNFVAKFSEASASKTDLISALTQRCTAIRPLTLASLCVALNKQLLGLDAKTASVYALSYAPPKVGIADNVQELLGCAERLGIWYSELSIFEICAALRIRL